MYLQLPKLAAKVTNSVLLLLKTNVDQTRFETTVAEINRDGDQLDAYAGDFSTAIQESVRMVLSGEANVAADYCRDLEREVNEAETVYRAKYSAWEQLNAESNSKKADLDFAEAQREWKVGQKEDADRVMAEYRQRVVTLEQQLTQARADLLQHRDQQKEHRGSFWIFSWTDHIEHIDNGERIVRENISNLQVQKSRLEGLINSHQAVDMTDIERQVTSTRSAFDTMVPRLAIALQERDQALVARTAARQKLQKFMEDAGVQSSDAMQAVEDLFKSVSDINGKVKSTLGNLITSCKLISDLDAEFAIESSLEVIALSDALSGQRILPRIVDKIRSSNDFASLAAPYENFDRVVNAITNG